MNIYDNIFRLADMNFFIRDFAAVKKDVTPPDRFKCGRGRVLYERFFYVVKGTIVFNDDAHDDLRFSAGDILYLPSDVTYESYWDSSEPGQFISLNFHLYDTDRNIINLSDDLVLACRDHDRQFLTFFNETFDIWNRSAHGYKLECASRLCSLLYKVANYSAKQDIGRKNSILKAVIYLEDNFLTDVTVEDLVKLSNTRECQFRRNFKRLKGMSPIKYRNMLRLNKAMEILKTGEYSVIEAAMTVGFDDSAYFSKLFKQQFGHSPSHYIP